MPGRRRAGSARTGVPALGIALVAVFAGPVTAAAYTPVSSGEEVTLAAGAAETFRFADLTPNSPVRITLTGAEVTDESLAEAALARSTTGETKPSTAGGTVDATVTLPATAEGRYLLVVRDLSTGTTTELTIHTALTFAETIPAAGLQGDSLLGLWLGGGALVLAGAGIAVATSVRRARAGL